MSSLHCLMEPFPLPHHILTHVRLEERSIELCIDYLTQVFLEDVDSFLDFVHLIMKDLAEDFSEDKMQLALKSLAILSPLCERFGLYQEKNKLDDLCLRLSNPPAYYRLSKELEQYKTHADQWIRKIVSRLNKVLSQKGHYCNIKGRYKHIYSIHQKLKKIGQDNVDKLSDLFGVRIIVPTQDEALCYEILHVLHDEFLPMVGSFKDYIAIPKINGYQSLHTGLKGVLEEYNLPIEIQIRTPVMDAFAEQGLAAHWRYAQKKESRLVNQIEQSLKKQLRSLGKIQGDVLHVLTYKGDFLRIEKGSTALDFAYFIHSDLGKQAEQAIINGVSVPLSTLLQEGDCIEIVKGKRVNSFLEQLKGVRTRLARTKIQQLIKKAPLHA